MVSAKGHEVHVLQPPSMKASDTGFMEQESEAGSSVMLHDVR